MPKHAKTGWAGRSLWLLVLFAAAVALAACTGDEPAVKPTPTHTATAQPTWTPEPTWTPVPTWTPTSTPALTTTHATPPISTSLLDTIFQRVSIIRELEPIEKVVPQFITRGELSTRLMEDLEDEREEIFKAQELLTILDLIPQDTDLYQLYLDLFAEQVLGFYDTESEELFVVQDVSEITPIQEVTLAHEYLHALQQQHFDIYSMINAVEDHLDASTALVALIEGDASLVGLTYLLDHLTPQQQAQVFESGSDSPVFDASPHFIRQDLVFPYTNGLDFTASLLTAGRWVNINNAFKEPPASTEQVLHSRKYLAREEPVAVTIPTLALNLGQGWSEVYTDTLGEFFLKTFLETLTTNDIAANAAAGWGGDKFTLVRGPDGQRALALLTSWDSTEDTLEFFEALHSGFDDSENTFIGLEGQDVLLIIAPNQALVTRIREQF